MSVHQLKDGRWIVHYRDPAHRDKWKREYFGRGLEAEQRARARNKELDLGPYTSRTPREGAVTFRDLAESYLQAKQAHMAATSIEALWYKLSGVICPEIGETEALRLTAHRMDQYVAKRLRRVKRVTIHRELSDIQAILNWAVKRQYLPRNPIAGYEKPKRDDEIIQPPTQAEINILLPHCPAHVIRALTLCYYTGLRPGNSELYGIEWTAIDWDLKVVTIRSAKKGGKPHRLVPIHEELLELLQAWHRADDYAAGLIIHYRGRRIRSIKRAFARAKKKAGITRRLPPYAFRHAFATYALGMGADLKSTSEILGHSRPDTTTRVYQHTDLKLHREAVDKVPAVEVPKASQ